MPSSTKRCSPENFFIALQFFAGEFLAALPNRQYRVTYVAIERSIAALLHSSSHNLTISCIITGKISKSGGKYVLEDAASKTAFSIDDQKTAMQYEGKSVVATGSLDTPTTGFTPRRSKRPPELCRPQGGRACPVFPSSLVFDGAASLSSLDGCPLTLSPSFTYRLCFSAPPVLLRRASGLLSLCL